MKHGTKKGITVLAFGTFDVLHPGHLAYLQQAAKLGDRLVVIIARDSTVQKLRGSMPVFSEKDRRLVVGALACVDKALLGDANDHIRSIARVGPDVICLGYDQRLTVQSLRSKLAKRKIAVKRIVRARHYKKEKYKSSLFKNVIRTLVPLP